MRKRFFIFLCGVFISVNALCANDTGTTCSGTGVVFDAESNGCVCDVGYYGDGVTCTKCPSHKSTENIGSTALADCKCDKGWGLENGACTKCPRHKYKSLVGDFQCVYCPAGQYTSAFGATSCTSCPPGHCCAYGDYYQCKKGTYGMGGTSCDLVQAVQQVTIGTGPGVCARGDGPTCSGELIDDQSIYAKGICSTKCTPGCTTSGVGAMASGECTVKTAKQFCVGTRCFKWPDNGSIAEQSLSNNIDTHNVNCPGNN